MKENFFILACLSSLKLQFFHVFPVLRLCCKTGQKLNCLALFLPRRCLSKKTTFHFFSINEKKDEKELTLIYTKLKQNFFKNFSSFFFPKEKKKKANNFRMKTYRIKKYSFEFKQLLLNKIGGTRIRTGE